MSGYSFFLLRFPFSSIICSVIFLLFHRKKLFFSSKFISIAKSKYKNNRRSSSTISQWNRKLENFELIWTVLFSKTTNHDEQDMYTIWMFRLHYFDKKFTVFLLRKFKLDTHFRYNLIVQKFKISKVVFFDRLKVFKLFIDSYNLNEKAVE